MTNNFNRLFPIGDGIQAWKPGGVGDEVTSFETLVTRFVNQSMLGQLDQTISSPTASEREKAKAASLKNQDIPAGYTYFGQFVDHDITRDETPLSEAGPVHGAMKNQRTPTLDLDSVYRGKLMDNLFEIGIGEENRFPDLPRGADGSKASIGDDRNDENAIVSQIHLAFLLAHNELVRRARREKIQKPFEEAKRILTWLYHWIILRDFLPRVVRDDVLELALDNKDTDFSNRPINFNLTSSQIPAEFSVAAYRFGHSMVRNSYQTNDFGVSGAGFGVFIDLFDGGDSANPDLAGKRKLRPSSTIQWDWFLEMDSSQSPLFPQRAERIDTKLSPALAKLHEGGGINNVLAARNILRGVRNEMPQSTNVANQVNGFLNDLKPGFGKPLLPDQLKTQSILGGMLESLWIYILAEAEHEGNNKLGLVGSTIVAFTFIQLLKNTKNSYFNVSQDWTPDSEFLLTNEDNKDPADWGLASVIRLSGLRVN